MSKTDYQKVEELAKELFLQAMAGATDLGQIPNDERIELIRQVRNLCHQMAQVFYGVAE
jgi:hypothetical protein